MWWFLLAPLPTKHYGNVLQRMAMYVNLWPNIATNGILWKLLILVCPRDCSPIFFYRSNLIFWIVMGCGIADFGRRALGLRRCF